MEGTRGDVGFFLEQVAYWLGCAGGCMLVYWSTTTAGVARGLVLLVVGLPEADPENGSK